MDMHSFQSIADEHAFDLVNVAKVEKLEQKCGALAERKSSKIVEHDIIGENENNEGSLESIMTIKMVKKWGFTGKVRNSLNSCSLNSVN